MTNFSIRGLSTRDTTTEEIEKKIEAVNSSMVAARNDAARYKDLTEGLKGQIDSLEKQKAILEQEIKPLVEQKLSLSSEVDEFRKVIGQKKIEAGELGQQLDTLKKLNVEEAKGLVQMKADLEKRKADLDGQESVLRNLAKGLDEKEKKLDIYADRVKRLLDSVKPE